MLNLLRELVLTLTEGPCSGSYFTISNRFGEPSLGINLLISGLPPGPLGTKLLTPSVPVLPGGPAPAARGEPALPGDPAALATVALGSSASLGGSLLSARLFWGV